MPYLMSENMPDFKSREQCEGCGFSPKTDKYGRDWSIRYCYSCRPTFGSHIHNSCPECDALVYEKTWADSNKKEYEPGGFIAE